MNLLRAIASLFTLLLVVSCATRAPRAADQSVLDVLDAASYSPQGPRACGITDVNYCVVEPSGRKACACVNAADIASQLAPLAR
jgi:hypothetical protein